MFNPVLYMGDTSLDTAAGYLAGVLQAFQVGFDYAASSQRFDDALLNKPYRAVILSDYPSANFSAAQLERLKTKVAEGLGLVMIGGWESFTGLGGGYQKTVLSEILPVVMRQTDDRMNCSCPCVVEKTAEHAITARLPLDDNLPVIGGFNSVSAKANSVVVLSVRRFNASKSGDLFTFNPCGISPLLAVGTCGKGKVAAFMSDAAPHWVGGLVDWGEKRIAVKINQTAEVEFGEHYASLFANIIRWTGNIEF